MLHIGNVLAGSGMEVWKGLGEDEDFNKGKICAPPDAGSGAS